MTDADVKAMAADLPECEACEGEGSYSRLADCTTGGLDCACNGPRVTVDPCDRCDGSGLCDRRDGWAAQPGSKDQDEPPRQTADYEYRLTWETPGVACLMAHQDVAWESLADDEWAALPWEKRHRVEPGSTRGDIHDQRYKLEMWAEDHYEPVRNVRFERRPLVNPDTEWSESELAVRTPGGVPWWVPVVAVAAGVRVCDDGAAEVEDPPEQGTHEAEVAYSDAEPNATQRDRLAARVREAESERDAAAARVRELEGALKSIDRITAAALAASSKEE